jgi:hypothetical protein
VDIGSDYHIRDSIDREQKQTRLISSRLLLDQHNKFNSLAEYLYKNGQAENPTLSTLLRVTIEHLLAKYHDVLEEYCNRTDCIKDTNCLISQSSSSLLLPQKQETKEQSESDMTQYVNNLIIDRIISCYNKNKKYNYDNE